MLHLILGISYISIFLVIKDPIRNCAKIHCHFPMKPNEFFFIFKKCLKFSTLGLSLNYRTNKLLQCNVVRYLRCIPVESFLSHSCMLALQSRKLFLIIYNYIVFLFLKNLSMNVGHTSSCLCTILFPNYSCIYIFSGPLWVKWCFSYVNKYYRTELK